MAFTTADLESELIDALCGRIRDELPEDHAAILVAFVHQYYHWVPPDDLAGRDPSDLYGAAIAHWSLARHRAPGEVKVRVYNPERERDGWSSAHTVIEIVSDDMPFIVDSVTMELARSGLTIDLVIHPVIGVRRDGHGRLLEVLAPGELPPDGIPESVSHAEVVREPDPELLEQLRERIERLLQEVSAAVADWQAMRSRALELARELEHGPPGVESSETTEVKAFLEWVADDHFTFLGCRDYDLVAADEQLWLEARPETGLGILRRKRSAVRKPLSAEAAALARAPHLLILTKANSHSTVHRPSYLDYIGIKRFDAEGNVTGERRFLGLYTSSAYRARPREIPLLRGKVATVLERTGFLPTSHDAKALLEVLETFPRDALFQIETDDLFGVAMGLLGLGERQRVRLFVWEDPLDRFVSCLVTIPRDRFNTENRQRVGRILLDSFSGTQLDWSLQLSESLLARVHYIVDCAGGVPERYDVPHIEARLARATRAWSDDLRQALISEHGEGRGVKLYRRYLQAFPTGYRSDWSVSDAVRDIGRIEQLDERGGAIINLYRRAGDRSGLIRCKL